MRQWNIQLTWVYMSHGSWDYMCHLNLKRTMRNSGAEATMPWRRQFLGDGGWRALCPFEGMAIGDDRWECCHDGRQLMDDSGLGVWLMTKVFSFVSLVVDGHFWDAVCEENFLLNSLTLLLDWMQVSHAFTKPRIICRANVNVLLRCSWFMHTGSPEVDR